MPTRATKRGSDIGYDTQHPRAPCDLGRMVLDFVKKVEESTLWRFARFRRNSSFQPQERPIFAVPRDPCREVVFITGVATGRAATTNEDDYSSQHRRTYFGP